MKWFFKEFLSAVLAAIGVGLFLLIIGLAVMS